MGVYDRVPQPSKPLLPVWYGQLSVIIPILARPLCPWVLHCGLIEYGTYGLLI